jgi:hypothetical protein
MELLQAASVALELRLPARSAQGQDSALPILSRNTIVAVPDGELRRRLIGVEHLRQGWGRKCTGTARTGRPATDQPTRGTRTPAHAAVPIGTWRPGPDGRRSVGLQTGGCGSSPPSTPSAAAEAINGRLEHLRGSALRFRNLTNYIARSLLEAGGFRPHLHPQIG